MGRMKEIFMEVQEKFDGDIPNNFDFEQYISQKVNENKPVEISLDKLYLEKRDRKSIK